MEHSIYRLQAEGFMERRNIQQRLGLRLLFLYTVSVYPRDIV